MKNILLLIIIVFCVFSVKAQEEYFSVKGKILSADSLQPIPNVNIVSELSHYGTITNQEGFFIIKSKTVDTLWVSCVGFDTREVPVWRDSILNNTLIIKLIRSNIMLDSVEIYPLPPYKDFIKDIAKMPMKKPFFVPGVSRADDAKRIWKRPERESPPSVINPISLIYKRFNKREVFKRKLQRNRKKFNKEMEKIGADSLMIPE
ncbi:MAG: carboxypeptidase-like regulatory domain-containing protein [Bacteroidales bacterium]|nr:carboxypeptidase-like regulatory domain-containing protein [Bacteroidales bacterium]